MFKLLWRRKDKNTYDEILIVEFDKSIFDLLDGDVSKELVENVIEKAGLLHKGDQCVLNFRVACK